MLSDFDSMRYRSRIEVGLPVPDGVAEELVRELLDREHADDDALEAAYVDGREDGATESEARSNVLDEIEFRSLRSEVYSALYELEKKVPLGTSRAFIKAQGRIVEAFDKAREVMQR